MDKQQLIQKIKDCPLEPEGYIAYGDFISKTSPEQAYLCYENAFFYNKDSAMGKELKKRMESCKEKENFHLQACSVIMLTYGNMEYTLPCIESIRATTDENMRELIVVDNGSTDGTRDWLKEQKDVIAFLSDSNLGFPGGCNKGVELATKGNDYLFLNNDTLLSANAIFWLRMGLYEEKDVASVGAISNYIKKDQTSMQKEISPKECLNYAMSEMIQTEQLYENRLFLIGYALLVRSEVFHLVNGFDEIYSPGNFEDQDICLKFLQMKMKNLLCYNSFIYHFSGKSFQVGSEEYNRLIEKNYHIFYKKWDYQLGKIRDDLISFMKESKYNEFQVVDVGCGAGATLMRLQAMYPNAKVLGIDKQKEVVTLMEHVVPIVYADIEDEVALPFKENSIDYLILGNVLEQLMDAKKFLERIKPYLAKDAKIIADIYNIRNTKIMADLCFGNMNYVREGILSQSNIRFFTLNSMIDLFYQSGFEIYDLTYDDKRNFYSLNENSVTAKISDFLQEENEELWGAESFRILAKMK